MPSITASPTAGQLAAGAAAWSLVHGLATLWLNGNLPAQLGDDPEKITRAVAPCLNIPQTTTATRGGGTGAREAAQPNPPR